MQLAARCADADAEVVGQVYVPHAAQQYWRGSQSHCEHQGRPRPPALKQTVRTASFVLHTDLDADGSDFHACLLEAFRAWFAARYFIPGGPAAPCLL